MISAVTNIAFLVNGTKKKAIAMANSFRENHSDLNIEILKTEYRGHAKELCSKNAGKLDIIISVGGDGTLNECVNGLMQVENIKRPAILVYAMGSGNDFVKSLSSVNSEAELFEKISSFKTKKVDVGKIEYTSEIEYFINIADAGMGAEVVKKVNASPQWLGTRMKFSTAILRTFSTYKNIKICCTWNDGKWEGLARSIIIANGCFFANGLCIAPKAKLDSGLFELIILGDLSLKDYLKYVPRIKKGELLNDPEVHYHQTTRIKISGESCMEMDGELGKDLPVEISVVPLAIRFVI